MQRLILYCSVACRNNLLYYSIYVKGMLLTSLCLVFHLQFEGRKYCEHDFQMLFAPCCHQCGKFYIQVKYFTLITNGKSTYVAGGRCAALLYLLWEVAPHS